MNEFERQDPERETVHGDSREPEEVEIQPAPRALATFLRYPLPEGVEHYGAEVLERAPARARSRLRQVLGQTFRRRQA